MIHITSSTRLSRRAFLKVTNTSLKCLVKLSNARFSVNKPVPEIGDMNSTKEEVYDFYEFWGKFESWRNFKALDEHIVDESESREDRRWMEKQNTGKKGKTETRRI